MVNLKKIDKEKMLQKAQEKIAYYESRKEVYDIVVLELEKLDGKKITKRFATIIEKSLKEKLGDDFYVSYQKDTIWNDRYKLVPHSNDTKKDMSYQNMNTIYLKGENGLYNHQLFIEKERWLFNWDKYINDVKADIYLIESTNMIEEYNKSVDIILNTEKTLISGLKYELTK